MTRAALRDELVRELDHLSAEQLKAVHQLINTFTESTVQPAPDQDAVREVREVLSSFFEPLWKTTEEERALAGFEQAMGAFRIESLHRRGVSDAEALLKTYDRKDALRTLDALHLATYLRLTDRQWRRFVVADNRLYSVAEKEGEQ
jgi:predicted nucleic acid-binding protein